MKKFIALGSFFLALCCFPSLGWTWPLPPPNICDCPPELLHVTTRVDDAGIKMLPSVWPTLVPAPGPGKKNVLITSSLDWHIFAPYTNISGNIMDASIGIAYGNNSGRASVITNFFPTTNKSAVLGPNTKTINEQGWSPTFSRDLVENMPLKLVAENAGGDLIGGSPSNTLIVTVYFVVVDIN